MVAAANVDRFGRSWYHLVAFFNAILTHIVSWQGDQWLIFYRLNTDVKQILRHSVIPQPFLYIFKRSWYHLVAIFNAIMTQF